MSVLDLYHVCDDVLKQMHRLTAQKFKASKILYVWDDGNLSC